MAWEQRFLSSSGTPSGWQNEGKELEKFGCNLNLGDEPLTGLASVFAKGSVMRPMSLAPMIRVGSPSDSPKEWDDRAWTSEFLSLMETPLFTPQDVKTKQVELKHLRAAFIKRHMRTIKILVQEREWKYNYKTLKPIVATSSCFGYLANNAFFKVQHDIRGRYSPDGYLATSDLLRSEMNASANALTASQTNISSPLM